MAIVYAAQQETEERCSCGGMLWSMKQDDDKLVKPDYVIESIKAEIEIESPSRRRRILEAIAVAALGGIPWVGGVISGVAAYRSGGAELKQESLLREWLQEHYEKLQILRATLESMVTRLEGFGEEVEKRITSEEYLNLVRKTFRQWDQADTAEKRRVLVQLITNAAGTRICSDDIIRLFLDWIDIYHEAHFAVIQEIYKNQGPTRYDIWVAVYGEPVPRDNSAEADLYKMLIRDLSTGGVIRQPREADYQGRWRKKTNPRRTSSGTLESAFEDTKPYVLTELGKQFVHYTMTELVARLGGPESGETQGDTQSNCPGA
jgi:hypothetical protein